jgi:hypothetical protein
VIDVRGKVWCKHGRITMVIRNESMVAVKVSQHADGDDGYDGFQGWCYRVSRHGFFQEVKSTL